MLQHNADLLSLRYSITYKSKYSVLSTKYTFALDFHAASCHRQRPGSQAGGLKNGRCDRRRNADDRRFARADRGQVGPIEKHRLQLWRVAEPRDTIGGKCGILDLSTLEINCFEQCPAQALHYGAFDLILEMIR